MSNSSQWPQKTRELQNHHMDSSIWNDFEIRNNDIIIATYAKAGTTWMQQIVSQLLFKGDASISAHDYSPWLELRVIPREEIMAMMNAQQKRRFIKTHLPLDALVFSPRAKYIYVARNLPDIVWSLHNHLVNALDISYEMSNDTPGRVGPPLPMPPDDVYEFWQLMLHEEYQVWSFWENIRTWWEYRHLSNIKLVHFNDLKADLPGEISELAKYLQIEVEDSKWGDIIEHCSFSWMKENAEQVTPMAGDIFAGGAKTFINKGTNQRWKDILNDKDIEEYLTLAEQQLGKECAHWLVHGYAK